MKKVFFIQNGSDKHSPSRVDLRFQEAGFQIDHYWAYQVEFPASYEHYHGVFISGSAVELYNYPENVFVAGFLGECNLIPATVQDISNGKVQIQFESGHIVQVSQGKESFSAGESVILLIRPEYIYTGSQAQAAENKFKGAVEEVIFSGDSYKLFIQFMDQTLISSTPNRHDLNPKTAGQNLDFGFNSSESFLLPV